MLTKYFTKISFVFLIYTIISNVEINKILPCQIQKFIKTNILFKHILGVLMVFGLLMMEGGFEFVDEAYATDWTNGNSLTSIVWALIIYFFLLLSSKMFLKNSIILFSLLLITYIINTYKNNLKLKNLLHDDHDILIYYFSNTMISVILVLLFSSVIQYYRYQRAEYKKKFSIYKFILGTNECTLMKNTNY